MLFCEKELWVKEINKKTVLNLASHDDIHSLKNSRSKQNISMESGNANYVGLSGLLIFKKRLFAERMFLGRNRLAASLCFVGNVSVSGSYHQPEKSSENT